MSLGANETGRITLTIAAPRTLGQISPVQSGVVMDFDGVEHLVGTLSSDISMNKDYTISMWLRPEVTDDAASHIQVMHNVIGSSDRNVISIEDNAIRF